MVHVVQSLITQRTVTCALPSLVPPMIWDKARAICVFPQPGGPYNNTPTTGGTPILSANSGNLSQARFFCFANKC